MEILDVIIALFIWFVVLPVVGGIAINIYWQHKKSKERKYRMLDELQKAEVERQEEMAKGGG